AHEISLRTVSQNSNRSSEANRGESDRSDVDRQKWIELFSVCVRVKVFFGHAARANGPEVGPAIALQQVQPGEMPDVVQPEEQGIGNAKERNLVRVAWVQEAIQPSREAVSPVGGSGQVEQVIADQRISQSKRCPKTFDRGWLPF